MTADIIQIPPRRLKGPQPKRRLDDIRVVPFEHQPPAVTMPGEPWHLNAFRMKQVIVIREGADGAGHRWDDQHQRTVADFVTVRDAALAVQSRAIVELIDRAIRTCPNADEFAATVCEIMKRYGR